MVRLTAIAAVGVAAMTGLAAGQARANTIMAASASYSCAAGTCTQAYDTLQQTLDWTASKSSQQVVDLNLFDPSLGTLTGVIFVVGFTTDITSGALTNNSTTSSETFTFKQDTQLTMSTGGANTALDTALAGLNIDPKYSTSPTLTPGATYTIPANTTETASQSLTGPLSAFTGPGTVAIDASTLTGDTFIGGGGNISANITTVGDAVLNVTYTYTIPTPSVPEPFSAALLGSGLLGLGFVRFRRSR